MRCDEVQGLLDDLKASDVPAPAREHLAVCPACEAHARGWRLLRAGFSALAKEEVPEASLGFAARLLRHWEEADAQAASRAEFLERIGKRFVYATLMLTLSALLGLVLPSSGPLRAPTTPDVYMAQPEVATLESDPIFSDNPAENTNPIPARSTGGGEKNRR